MRKHTIKLACCHEIPPPKKSCICHNGKPAGGCTAKSMSEKCVSCTKEGYVLSPAKLCKCMGAGYGEVPSTKPTKKKIHPQLTQSNKPHKQQKVVCGCKAGYKHKGGKCHKNQPGKALPPGPLVGLVGTSGLLARSAGKFAKNPKDAEKIAASKGGRLPLKTEVLKWGPKKLKAAHVGDDLVTRDRADHRVPQKSPPRTRHRLF